MRLISKLRDEDDDVEFADPLPLADAAKAHAAVLEPGALGKIVLVP